LNSQLLTVVPQPHATFTCRTLNLVWYFAAVRTRAGNDWDLRRRVLYIQAFVQRTSNWHQAQDRVHSNTPARNVLLLVPMMMTSWVGVFQTELILSQLSSLDHYYFEG